MNASSFFCVNHLNCSYGKKQILTDVTFSLSRGSVNGLLGANGSGKTTLLKAICNQLPHSGECRLMMEPLELLGTRRLAGKISYIPQRSGITTSISLLDVVLMGFNPRLRLLENPSQAQKDAARHALSEVGLKGMEAVDYLSLSEGEKQLCILARTLVEDTPLLLLDEPDSALDFHNRYHMLQMLKRLVCSFDRTALICLHDPGLALDFCDQILLLKNGQQTASIYPASDEHEQMEAAFSTIYGPVSLICCRDRKGRERLALLSEQELPVGLLKPSIRRTTT